MSTPRDSFHRSVQVVERVFVHAGGDFRPDAALRPAFFDDDDASGFFGDRATAARVEKFLAPYGEDKGAKVDDFRAHAVFFELFGGF